MERIEINEKLFFISDFHVGHKNIIRFDNRPFNNIHDMHSALIKNWNSVIEDDDVVFYLGDLCFGSPKLSKWFVEQLKGKIYFILGNHDRMRDISRLNRFENIYEYGTELLVKDESVLNKRSGGYQQMILTHYPVLSWNNAHHGSWHLHGHSHQSLTKNADYKWFYNRKVIDIGCNGFDYTPVSYLRIKEIMDSKVIISDHHKEKSI